MSRPSETQIRRHLNAIKRCRKCPDMNPPPVVGQAAVGRVILVGQAPGIKEPEMQRPFAWTAGKTMFKWFAEYAQVDEPTFRARVYMAAVCRCFPGKGKSSGDRVPNPSEIGNCAGWLQKELCLLEPDLIIPVGKLAIGQFLALEKLDQMIGKTYHWDYQGRTIDVIPLPHPSGASPWHRMEPGKSLMRRAMRRIARHPAFVDDVLKGGVS